MKKVFLLAVLVCIAISFSGCGFSNYELKETNEPTEATEVSTAVVPNSVPEGSDADIAVRECVSAYLDTFISADMELIKSQIHEDDMWLFNFDSEEQIAFYKTIFPKIEYKFEFVSEHEGVYGVMTEITSPDMADVYGTIITDYIDSTTGEGSLSVEEIMSNSTETMLDMITSPDLAQRCERLYIYVQYIDGEYIPRCDVFLANELTGGAPEVSDELSSTLYETVKALQE